MALDAWFRETGSGRGRWELDEIVYRSNRGELLEVAHDLEALAATPAAQWRRLWSERWRGHRRPFASGVWGKKELVLPNVPVEHVVSLDEGATSLLPSPRLAEAFDLDEIMVKQCGTTHTGSFKDLGMTVLVSQVNHLIRSGKHEILGVACASTGDTSAALAAYCAAAGIPSVVLIPHAKISPAQLVQPMANGALTLALETDFDGCMRLVRELTEDRRLYLANSMNSLRVEGQKTIAAEIVQQLDWEVPDRIFIPGGNLGNLSALYKGFEELLALGVAERIPRICCCQASAAEPLYRYYRSGWRDYAPMEAGETQASAIRIGDPVSLPKAVRALREHGGQVEVADEQELAEACAIADRCGLFTCPHTGVALAALRKMRARGEVARDERAVVISTAHGLKFTEVKTAYHEERLAGVRPERPNRPVVLPAETGAVYDAVERHRAAMAE